MRKSIKVNQFPRVESAADLTTRFPEGLPENQIIRGPDNQLYQVVGNAQMQMTGLIPQMVRAHKGPAQLASMGEDVSNPNPANLPFEVQAFQNGVQVVPFDLKNSLNRRSLLDYIKGKIR